MVKKKKNKVVGIKGKDGRERFNLNFSKGEWFNPLKQNQVIEGVFTKTFVTDSKFKNTRENSEAFGKNAKVNYEITRDKGTPICISETGGPIQSLLDSLNVGDRVHFEFVCLKREDGELCPKTVKTPEQLKKWKARQKAWPVWGENAWIKRGRNQG